MKPELQSVGDFILEELNERGWSIQTLLNRMGGDPETELALDLILYANQKGLSLGEETAQR